jgi:hypothetical protein
VVVSGTSHSREEHRHALTIISMLIISLAESKLAFGLADVFVARQVGQRLPLRARQPETTRMLPVARRAGA